MQLEIIYENVYNKYLKTGKIGPVKPFNMEHAKKVAFKAAQSIYERSTK
jgi:hypothetical protein